MHFDDLCDDRDCVLCQKDNADAAFWDEFFYQWEQSEEQETGGEATVRLVIERTGEEVMWDGVTLPERVVKGD